MKDTNPNLNKICIEIINRKKVDQKTLEKLKKNYPKNNKELFSVDEIIKQLRELKKQNKLQNKKIEEIINKIKLKPVRSISGVTTVTVLTKPFACPGQCIFCPNDVRMPKSYIATEPGAQRALINKFSPYLQVYNRLKALENIGHPTSKIELLILGGTWSYYPEKYKVWFILECFRSMNNFSENKFNYKYSSLEKINNLLEDDINKSIRNINGNKPYNQLIQTKEFKETFSKYIIDESNKYTLEELWENLKIEQNFNEKSKARCVGLVLETRPDCISTKEVLDMRKLGATKIQIGFQTLNDEISKKNKRNETKEQVINAFKLLRLAGFKIHGHFMPNLYGSNPEMDYEVYKEIFDSENFRPDELKIYPTSVIKNTELYEKFINNEYKPYSKETLENLLEKCISYTPEYCRLTRIIRDIPSTEIEVGNKTTNLRQIVEENMKRKNIPDLNIRNREIKTKKIDMIELKLKLIKYKCNGSTEYFIQYVTQDNSIVGFLRLSIPDSRINLITDELNECAIIREIHIYGPSIEISEKSSGYAQHLGLGTKLIRKAKEITRKNGFNKLAVISSIGTREYYKKRGFLLKNLYQITEL